MYISLWENSRGHPDNVSFMQFFTKIDGFEQKDSQGFENSYNSYEQYPLEKFLIFTIYQNYTLALTYYKYNTWENAPPPPPPPLKNNNSSDWQTWQIRVDIHHLSLGKEDLNSWTPW